MSRLLEQQDHFLELLRTTRKLQRQALLRTIDKSQLKALSEIIHNVIKGSIILSPSDKNRLKKYKKVLSVLGRMSTKRRDKLKALQSKATTIVHLLNVVSSRPWRKWYWYLTRNTNVSPPNRHLNKTPWTTSKKVENSRLLWRRNANWDHRELWSSLTTDIRKRTLLSKQRQNRPGSLCDFLRVFSEYCVCIAILYLYVLKNV